MNSDRIHKAIDCVRERGLEQGREQDGSIALLVYDEDRDCLAYGYHPRSAIERIRHAYLSHEDCPCPNHDMLPAVTLRALDDPPDGECWVVFFSIRSSMAPYLTSFRWRNRLIH